MAQSVWFDTKSSMVNGADVTCGESVMNPQNLLNTVEHSGCFEGCRSVFYIAECVIT